MSASDSSEVPPKCRHDSKPKQETYRSKKAKNFGVLLRVTMVAVFQSSIVMITLSDSQENKAQNDNKKSDEYHNSISDDFTSQRYRLIWFFHSRTDPILIEESLAAGILAREAAISPFHQQSNENR